MHKDFIGVYENAFSEKFCNDLIKYYEYQKSQNKTWGREEEDVKQITRVDEASSLTPIHIDEIHHSSFHVDGLHEEFDDVFWKKCYTEYAEAYPIVNSLYKHTIKSYKIQKTLPSQGYHIWHVESDGTPPFLNRAMAYILYLNEVEGGETEFLYQSMRVKPTTGTLVIWPAYYTHPHRGNPPLDKEKYVLTGWVEFL